MSIAAPQVITLIVLVLWVMVAGRTLQLAIKGDMFFAPCLKDIREKESSGDGDRRV